MALIEQIRGLDSTLGSEKTVVGALTTKTVSGLGELIQGFNGSSYVYYDGPPIFMDGDWSIAGDFENIEGAGNTNTLIAQGGSTGDGGGGRFSYVFGTWRFTAGGVADYDFSDVTSPSSGQARWMLTHNSSTNKLVFYINGLKAIAADDISIGTILTPSSPFVIIGAAWNGSGYSDITGSDSRNVHGNIDIYDTCFDAAQVAAEYENYLATDTNIDCNIGTATASGLAATIDAQRNIDCAIGTANASGLQAIIDNQVNINCNIGTAVASGLTATFDSTVTIECAIGTAVGSGLPATIDNQRNIDCNIGTAVASGLTVSFGGDSNITCNIGAAVASGLPAIIDNQINIQCNIGTAVASGLEVTFTAEGRLKQAIKEAYASAPSGVIVIHTLEFRHPAFVNDVGAPSAIRVVQAHRNLEAKLEDDAPQNPGEYVIFIPMSFDFEPPNVENIAIPEIGISIDNVSREIEDNLRIAAASPYPIEVTYRPYLNTDLTEPQMNPPVTLILTSAEADDYRVTARGSYGNAANVLCPRETYNRSRFPGLQR